MNFNTINENAFLDQLSWFDKTILFLVASHRDLCLSVPRASIRNYSSQHPVYMLFSLRRKRYPCNIWNVFEISHAQRAVQCRFRCMKICLNFVVLASCDASFSRRRACIWRCLISLMKFDICVHYSRIKRIFFDFLWSSFAHPGITVCGNAI